MPDASDVVEFLEDLRTRCLNMSAECEGFEDQMVWIEAALDVSRCIKHVRHFEESE